MIAPCLESVRRIASYAKIVGGGGVASYCLDFLEQEGWKRRWARRSCTPRSYHSVTSKTWRHRWTRILNKMLRTKVGQRWDGNFECLWLVFMSLFVDRLRTIHGIISYALVFLNNNIAPLFLFRIFRTKSWRLLFDSDLVAWLYSLSAYAYI